jgi:hypothetical protein
VRRDPTPFNPNSCSEDTDVVIKEGIYLHWGCDALGSRSDGAYVLLPFKDSEVLLLGAHVRTIS